LGVKLIIIDENSQVCDWFGSLGIEDIGFARVDLGTFEIANGFNTELVLIQDTIYHQLTSLLKDKLSNVAAVIIFNSCKTPIQFFLKNVIAVVKEDSHVELIRNKISFVENNLKNNEILKSQLLSLNKELAETMEGVGSQLLRVKKIYEKKAPKRLENFKGFTIYSKYAAGEDMGGEFFDIFAKDNKIFMLMSASSSYIASSSILEYFSDLKGQLNISEENEINFITRVRSELQQINENKKVPVEAQIITCILDINTLNIVGHIFGSFQVMSSNLNREVSRNNPIYGNIENSKFELQLERGERILLNSPGFIKNWDMSKPKFMIEELVSNKKIKALDVLDEVYFQLRKESSTGFLSHDASSLILEVQSNVMLQV
jgi:hypothetical protein